MRRLLILAGVFSLSLLGDGCHSACKKMAKENGKLISGKESFGMKKNKRMKKKNRRGA
ncbi:MAG: hypothetical protein NT084_01205 [Bacteroidetes bacterium]|nr:hypothetical protein [Bacteroidota bacterium]